MLVHRTVRKYSSRIIFLEYAFIFFLDFYQNTRTRLQTMNKMQIKVNKNQQNEHKQKKTVKKIIVWQI